MNTNTTFHDRNRQRLADARAATAAQVPGSGASGRPRNEMIFFMQTIGALLVVLGHVPIFTGMLGQGLYHEVLHALSFRMPLFMFISGYLMKYGFGNSLPWSKICVAGGGVNR